MDTLLNQLIQLYSNNATNLYHLASHSTPCCTQHRDHIVTTDYCDVFSPFEAVFTN